MIHSYIKLMIGNRRSVPELDSQSLLRDLNERFVGGSNVTFNIPVENQHGTLTGMAFVVNDV